MAVPHVVALGRASHARLCTDDVTFRRAGPASFDPLTGQYSEASAVVYDGPARIKRAMSTDLVSGEREIQQNRPVLVLPYGGCEHDPGGLLPGDTGTVNSSLNPALVGATATVVSLDAGSTSTAYRYIVELVT